MEVSTGEEIGDDTCYREPHLCLHQCYKQGRYLSMNFPVVQEPRSILRFYVTRLELFVMTVIAGIRRNPVGLAQVFSVPREAELWDSHPVHSRKS